MRLTAVLLPLSLFLGGCLATSGNGRTQLVAPQPLGAAYSDVSLQRSLLLAESRACRPDTCGAVAAFNRQVQRVGERLVRAAAEEVRKEPLPRFDIRLLDTVERGTASSAAGAVVVHGGTRELNLEEPALAFLLAREIGHVSARHHDEDSATSLTFSLLGTMLFPVGNLLRGAAAAITATDGLTLATTAASVAGANAFKSTYRSEQLREADIAALQLAVRAGWNLDEIADAVAAVAPQLRDEGWSGELLVSKTRLDHIVAGPPWPVPDEVAVVSVVASVQAPAPITPSTTLTRSP